jgi:hypothetical protein
LEFAHGALEQVKEISEYLSGMLLVTHASGQGNGRNGQLSMACSWRLSESHGSPKDMAVGDHFNRFVKNIPMGEVDSCANVHFCASKDP